MYKRQVEFKSGSVSINDTSITYTNTDNVNNIWSAAYEVSSSDTDGDVSYTIQCTDLTGNSTTISSVNSDNTVSIDITAPTITAISTISNKGSYKEGEIIYIGIAFDKAISVTGSTIYPFIKLNPTGTALTYASYNSNMDDNVSNTIYMTYTVEANQTTDQLNIFSVTPFDTTNSTIIDSIGNNADLTLPSLYTNSSYTNTLYTTEIVIDTTSPNDPSNWSIAASRYGNERYQYASTDHTIILKLQFDETVTIDADDVQFRSGGENVNSTNISIVNTNTSTYKWKLKYVVNKSDTQGFVGFTITYADLAGNTNTIDENISNQIADSSTSYSNVIIDSTPATLTKTFFGEPFGKTILTTGDTIRLEFTSTESVAYTTPSVSYFGLDSNCLLYTSPSPRD